LLLLYKYFNPQIIDELPEEVLAMLVGVLPKTIAMARQSLKSQRTSKQRDSQPVEL
jgi:hypothetical protein